MQRNVLLIFLLISAVLANFCAVAQPGTSVEIDKPKQYESRTLGAEKTGDKKFSFARKLYQNTVTHYNYTFNANEKLNEIVTQAKMSFRDDYTLLLPFYNYSLDVTASSGDLDSVIYKCNAGILLHDLRNDWIDNLYVLMGEAYFYRKNFDSAIQVFRYVNYAFAPKEDGGYDIPIGSNASGNNGTFSVSTKEKSGITQKIFATPPSRNESLLWMGRSLTEMKNYGEASGIYEILHIDPLFPERLQPLLEEQMAYLDYRQGRWDSAAVHLSKALEAADNRQEKARMEFLVAQLYERSDSTDKAVDWYTKAASTTVDPVMEVYANLNAIKAVGGKDETVLKQKLDNLIKMAKRDKYVGYRDIIYYAIAQVELELHNDAAAEDMLRRSIRYNTIENPTQRSKSFLLLADIQYNTEKYIPSHNYYDSVETSAITDSVALARVNLRKSPLAVIADDLTSIDREDSLQQIAAMPKDQREAYVKKMVRNLRRAQGLKEEPELSTNPAVQQSNGPDLFNPNTAIAAPGNNASGEWYFNNLQVKSSGANQFKALWGNRPNADNWQRLASIRQVNNDQQNADDSSGNENITNVSLDNTSGNTDENGDITFESVNKNLPLTEEQMDASNEKIADALLRNGKTFQDELEDYPAAIKSYNELLNRFPTSKNKEEALFNLYYCYSKTGNQFAADSVKNALQNNFASGEFTNKLLHKAEKQEAKEDAATVLYKNIYDLFLSGSFKEAEKKKLEADSIYGNSYWTPQLLYIESIYYITEKADSTAIGKLINLQNMYPKSPLAEKAATMVDVLRRRKEIETYLTNLEIKRYEEDETPVVDLNTSKPVVIPKKEIKQDSVVTKTITQVAKPNVDTTTKAAPPVIKSYEWNPKEPQYVAVLLNGVAQVFINEAKNAFTKYNAVNYYAQKLTTNIIKINDQYSLVLIGPFTDAAVAMEYADKARPVTGSRIIPWLTADKYNYTIISQGNVDVMSDTKDVDGYKALLEKVLPGKF